MGCIPWDYPVPLDTDSVASPAEVCVKNYEDDMIAAFNSAMDDVDAETCECLPDCESVTYDVRVYKIPLPEPKRLCYNTVIIN